ncbi:DUF4139 domain-containing protein [uncultured Cytophaga sp.]|uniref:DUF4139 domain-containing protein n=1 Tax=uncultured Cytophaga sp. TaxID=160238 RepID=UPI0026023225|nr:DUF4139 domain-containing protein [uncultured Cytophaga sp.]
MKKSLFISLIVILANSFNIHAQENIITANPTIKQVTVFLNRAQVETQTPITIENGKTVIRLQNQTTFLDPESIQVSGKGDFTILSVEHEMDYLKKETKPVKIQMLEDSIAHYSMLVDFNTQINDVLNKEEQLILSNQNIKGQNTNLTAKELSDMAHFFREHLEEIREEVIDNKMLIKKYQSSLTRFNNQLAEYNQIANQPSSTIIVTVSAKTGLTGSLTTSYITSNAGWYPLYDIRAKDAKSPVQLAYKAQVFQKTGYDWKNVKIVLSTSNPSVGGNKPELTNWFVDIYDPTIVRYKKQYKAIQPAMEMESYSADDKDYAKTSASGSARASSVADYISEVETTLSIEFAIGLPYSILSGGKGQQVDIKNIDLPADYQYAVVPKLDLSAFLLARITKWDTYNILSGNANIYFEGTFVGKTYIDASNTTDTLNISLGRDPRIVVERNIITDYTSKKMIGTNRKEEYAYEISIRNTKKEPIVIVVEDQYPISKNSSLEVELLESSGASIDATIGKITWKINMATAETKKLILKYSVKYPKDKKVSGM